MNLRHERLSQRALALV